MKTDLVLLHPPDPLACCRHGVQPLGAGGQHRRLPGGHGGQPRIRQLRLRERERDHGVHHAAQRPLLLRLHRDTGIRTQGPHHQGGATESPVRISLELETNCDTAS